LCNPLDFDQIHTGTNQHVDHSTMGRKATPVCN
jgi:hypothetical protein